MSQCLTHSLSPHFSVFLLRVSVPLWFISFPLLLCGCNAGHGDNAAEASTSRQDAKVRVAPIKPVRKTLTRYSEQPGQVAALEETPLLAKVSGYVRTIHVDIGDEVRGPVRETGRPTEPGQLLVELEVPELEKELAQKEAAVKQAESEITQAAAAVKVAEAMRDSAEALVEEAEASTERATADFERWKSELARVTDLASRGAVTDKLVDETQSKLRAAEAARKEIAAKIRSAQANFKESDALIEKATADLGAAKAKLGVAEPDRDRLKTLLSFAEIRAPFDGRVAARGVDTGHLVTAGSSEKEPLLVIVNTKTVRVYVDVPEIDAVHIEPQAEATIRMPSLAGGFEGKVTRTTWVLNQTTRTLRVEIDVPNEDGRLRPGMYAHARLKVAERPDATVLPKTALMTGGGQISCWRIESDGALRRAVLQTGIEAGGEIEIVSGLDGDEQIIGVNAAAFREGQQVEVVEAKK
jgi:HlyD family secretion protein